MHPLAIAAGIGVSMAAYGVRRRWKERRFWRWLEAAGRGRLEKAGPRSRRLILADGRGLALTFYDESLEISIEPDAVGVPDFQVFPFLPSGRLLHELQPALLGPGLFTDTLAPELVGRMVDAPARELLRSLGRSWSVGCWHQGRLRLSIPRWPLGSLREQRTLAGIDALSRVASAGARQLEPFGRLPGARVHRNGVSLGACELRAIVYRRDFVVELSVAVGSSTSGPFVVVWEDGVQSGHTLALAAPPFPTARLRFDGERVHLAVVGLRADDVAPPMAYLQRAVRALANGTTPFR